ncbi:protein ninX [Salmonella enterica]|nr:protein ninX [Salmonella enterica]
MDYSKLSDFEINKRVAILLSPELASRECYDISGRAVFHDKSGTCGFSYISDPADAWPIIAENEISIIFNWNEDGLHGATNQPWISSENSNPLRAAMECFLLMQESSNVQANPARPDIL